MLSVKVVAKPFMPNVSKSYDKSVVFYSEVNDFGKNILSYIHPYVQPNSNQRKSEKILPFIAMSRFLSLRQKMILLNRSQQIETYSIVTTYFLSS